MSKIKVELGRTYKTRHERSVYIFAKLTGDIPQPNLGLVFVGVDNGGSVNTWTEKGVFNPSQKGRSVLDLIETASEPLREVITLAAREI